MPEQIRCVTIISVDGDPMDSRSQAFAAVTGLAAEAGRTVAALWVHSVESEGTIDLGGSPIVLDGSGLKAVSWLASTS